jgi:arylformamidase
VIIDVSRVLDESSAVFPGDVPFSREVTLSMRSGDSCNVSSVRGSSHAGTHVDLPLHFSDDATEPALDAFMGPAVVIEVDDWARLDSIAVRPGFRVLFKTRNSLADRRAFDPDFVCLSADAVTWLVRNGVVLVGVDGPSVDRADSSDLANHHALHAAGIAILENLDLSAAPAGECELIALPLRIAGADATWVRAAIRVG